MKKSAKYCFEYFVNTINSEGYKEYKEKAYAENLKNHREYIKNEKPEWITRDDYYEEGDICYVVICDVLSNDGVAKLSKKIHSLPAGMFDANVRYKRPLLTKKYSYVNLQYSHSGMGIFAEVKLKNDKYISGIDIYWTQINNYYGFFEYKFKFKRALDDKLYTQFIIDKIKFLNKKDYLDWYHISEDSKDEWSNYLAVDQLHGELFTIICQHYITSYFYSEEGKKNKLVNVVCMTRKEEIDIDKLYLGDGDLSYYNKQENYVVTSEFGDTNFYLRAGNNMVPHLSILKYVCDYGNDFYYSFFGGRELRIFENEFSRFSSGVKNIRYNKKLRNLLNKIQSLSKYEKRKISDMYSDFDRYWDFYDCNDIRDLKEYHQLLNYDYEGIYKENFSYLKLISEMEYTKVTTGATILATIIAVIALIISII